MSIANPERVAHLLWSLPQNDKTNLYVILDGARNNGIYPAVLKSECEFECLYTGELDPELAEAAPYLVKLERNKPFVDWLIKKGWGDSWGIFMHSEAPFRDLRRHFRKFLMVYDPDSKPIYFRYYDPRVLRIYLPTCNAEDLAILFGPVKTYLLEGKRPTTLLRFSNAVGQLQREEISTEINQEQLS